MIFRKSRSQCTRQQLRDGYVLYFVSLFTLFGALVLLELHTSSLGVLTSESTAGNETIYGTPKSIRSDEFLRSSPILIGEIRRQENILKDDKQTLGSPLDAVYADKSLKGDANTMVGDTSAFDIFSENVFVLDSALISMLPLNMEFAARWWLPSFLTFFGLGLIFRAINVSWKLSFICSSLVWTSASVQWWSLWPLNAIGLSAMACGLVLSIVKSLDEQWNSPTLLIKCIPKNLFYLLVSFIFAMRVPSVYAPWAVPVALFFAAFTVGCLILMRISRETILRFLTPLVAFSVAASIPFLMAIQQQVQKITDTVYPGERRFSGFADFPSWSGPASWLLQTQRAAGLNQSEIALGLVILLPISLIVVMSKKSVIDTRQYRAFFVIVIGILLIYLLWAITSWPEVSRTFFIISQIPPLRILQILGVLTPITFVLSLDYWHKSKNSQRSEIKLFIVVFIITLLFTLFSVGELKNQHVTNITDIEVWLISLSTGFLLALPVIRRAYRVALVSILLTSAASVANVNPLVQGLGIFGETTTMEIIEGAKSLENGRWASDSFIFDSLPVGAGARMLSGNQGLGPNKDAYALLDPSLSFVNQWNRGGSYATFNWSQNSEVSFNNPSQDIVAIVVSPCNSVLDSFDLSWVVSSGDQSVHECLVPYSTIELQGITFVIFKRN